MKIDAASSQEFFLPARLYSWLVRC